MKCLVIEKELAADIMYGQRAGGGKTLQVKGW